MDLFFVTFKGKIMGRILILCFLASLVFSCASVKVNYDYEKSTDFNSYRTYNYYSDMNMGMSELDSKRILDAMDAVMQTKGLSLSDNPDFLINITTREYQESRHNNVGVGLGGSGGRVGGGLSIGIPVGQANVNREIVFEFVDENKSGLFWQAISESSYNPNAKPEAREAKFRAIVSKVLAGYPPAKK